MVNKNNKSFHLDEHLKNNSETNSNEVNELLEDIKVTIEKNKEIIAENRKILESKKQKEDTVE